MDPELISAMKTGRTMLFMGSGVSATLGVPTWSGLIAKLANKLGYDERLLAPPGVNYLTLAQFFYEKYKQSGIADLCNEMSAEWNASEEKLKNSEVHKLLYKLRFPTIYTTNYDQNLENAFRLFGGDPLVVNDISQFGLGKASDQTIIKFHGDLTDPNRIVLTESQYFERLNFEAPLDIRLRSDALSNSILFIGYSLSDINVRLLLYKLSNMWKNDNNQRPKSFILLSRPNQMEEVVLGSWGIKVITHDDDDPSHMLVSFLEQLVAAVGNGSGNITT